VPLDIRAIDPGDASGGPTPVRENIGTRALFLRAQ